MKKIEIKAISFDFWNTLYIHNYTKTKRKEIRNNSIEYFFKNYKNDQLYDELINSFFNNVDTFVKNRWESNLSSSDSEITNYIYDFYNKKYPKHFLLDLLNELYRIYENELKPIQLPYVENIIKSLHEKIKLFIISDTYTIKSDSIERILKKDNLDRYFIEKYFSDRIGEQKPSSKTINIIMERENIDSKNILHIGDLIEKDFKLAENSGCYFIHYSTNQENSLISSQYLMPQ